MSDVHAPAEIERWLDDLAGDLADLYVDGRCGPYRWAHSGLASVTQSRWESGRAKAYLDPVGDKAAREQVAKVQRAADAIRAARVALRAARNVLQPPVEDVDDVPPVGGWITRREHKELLARQAAREAAGGGFGES